MNWYNRYKKIRIVFFLVIAVYGSLNVEKNILLAGGPKDGVGVAISSEVPTETCTGAVVSEKLTLDQMLLSDDLKSMQSAARDFLSNPLNVEGTKRIAACPLISVNYSDILAKLSVIEEKLKGTKCKEDNKQIFTDLQQTIKDVDGYMVKSDEATALKVKMDAEAAAVSSGATGASATSTTATTGTGATTPPKTLATQAQAYGKTIGNAMDVLAKIAVNEQCMYNVRERGILPVLADVVVNFSQLALLYPGPMPGVPNPNAFMIAGGGIALGSILKILHSLFANPFDWNNVDERKKFVDLVCTFYNTRIELKKMQFFRLKTPKDEGILKTAKIIDSNIDATIKKLEDARSLEVAVAMGGSANKELFTLLPSIIEKLSPPVVSEEAERAMNFKDKAKYDKALADYKLSMPPILKDLKEKVGKLNIDAKKYPSLVKLPENIKKILDIDPDNAVELYSKSAKEIGDYLIPALNDIQSVLDKEAQNAEKEVVKKYATYADTLKSMGELKGKMKEFVVNLNQIVNEKHYRPIGDGTFNKQAILESIKRNSDQLFGDVGWSFVNYVMDRADVTQREFSAQYVDLFDKYEAFKNYVLGIKKKDVEDGEKTAESESEKEEGMRRLCSSVTQAINDYQNSVALTDMGTDFLDSIKDISHNNVSRFKTFLLIPRGFSSGKNLLKQQKDLMRFRKLESAGSLDKGDLQPFGKWRRVKMKFRWNYIGTIIETNEENRGKAEKMREFLLDKSNKCEELMYIAAE